MFKLIQRSRYIDFDKFSIGLLFRISSAPRRSLRLHSSNSPINSNKMVKVYDSYKIASVCFPEDNLSSSIAMDAVRCWIQAKILQAKEKLRIEITVYTDAATDKNIGSGIAFSAYIAGVPFMKRKKAIYGVCKSGRAEILAVQFALEKLLWFAKYIPVIIRTDHEATVKAMIKGCKDSCKDKKDYDALKELVTSFCYVRFEKVRAHRGVKGNEEADRIAKAAIEEITLNHAGYKPLKSAVRFFCSVFSRDDPVPTAKSSSVKIGKVCARDGISGIGKAEQKTRKASRAGNMFPKSSGDKFSSRR